MTVRLRKSEKEKFLSLIPQFKKVHILVIGDFILDQFVWGNVRRISPEAPVPVVNVQRESYMPGGCLNVAHNIRTLGGTVYPCGVVGRDLEGRLLLKTMRRDGIDTGGIIYDKTRPTSVKTRVIAHSQQVVRFDREKDENISPADVKKILHFVQSKIQSADVVILEDYGKGVIQEMLLKAVLSLAKKYKKPILVDPKEKNFPYYVGVTAITPNRAEACAALRNGRDWHGEDSVEEIGRGLLKQYKTEAVLMTLGEDGMALFEKNSSTIKIPTVAREVFDVSGAGDTVISVFALAIAAGAKMREAAILSNFAAGIVVGKLGTATVSPEELKEAVLAAS
ncbi:MAG: D-glycero-beta-D-manno-heptose-7-phosphate kinase [Candidatus Omnitrophica bacterium]|nr:D-glycero-beta-D-manno-heptose-7-phosphate kinase [Candidatus Omnitrophota bacterium]